MEKQRCSWCQGDPLYEAYHDLEWGVPLREDRSLFEFLTLECFQAGLSWITILRKRENFRKAFDGFDPLKVSAYGPQEIETLLQDPGIVRNRLKVHAAISNAKAFLETQRAYGSFADYIWGFVGGRPIKNAWKGPTEVPATTPLSDQISRDLKKRGFKFVGSTVVYAHMQATGMVNDHQTHCFRYGEV